MWDLGSLTRDWTNAPLHQKLGVLTTRPPGSPESGIFGWLIGIYFLSPKIEVELLSLGGWGLMILAHDQGPVMEFTQMDEEEKLIGGTSYHSLK